MIRAATKTQIQSLSATTLLGLKLRGLYEAYGFGRDFLPFWTDDAGGAGALLSGCAVAMPAAAQREEWACFLTMQPQVRQVETDEVTATLLVAQGFSCETRPVLQLPPQHAEDASLTPSLRELYSLLCEVFGEESLPPFDMWYTDMSHRLRHGCGRASAVCEEGQPISCALVTAECASAGLISGVATRADSRGRGYARRCVGALADALAADGKQAYICPKNAAADALYRRWGAVQTDTFCILKR